jgi:hypothetical protein
MRLYFNIFLALGLFLTSCQKSEETITVNSDSNGSSYIDRGPTKVRFIQQGSTVLEDGWTLLDDGSFLVERQRDTCSGFSPTSFQSLRPQETVEYKINPNADTTDFREKIAIPLKITIYRSDCITATSTNIIPPCLYSYFGINCECSTCQ